MRDPPRPSITPNLRTYPDPNPHPGNNVLLLLLEGPFGCPLPTTTLPSSTFLLITVLRCQTSCVVLPHALSYLMRCPTSCIVLPYMLSYLLHCPTSCIVPPRALSYLMHLPTSCIALPHALPYLMYCPISCIVIPHALSYLMHCPTSCIVLQMPRDVSNAFLINCVNHAGAHT